jgi:hypothetical protein
MNRREFLKRIAAGAALVVLDFKTGASCVFLRPTACMSGGLVHGHMVLGGNLFTAYARGGYSMNEPIQKLRLSQARSLAGWKWANNHGLQQLL